MFILYNDINVAENREAIWLNVWLVGLVLAGDVRLRRRQCWTAGSTRMAQNAQKSRHVRHFLGRMSQYRAFGNGVDFLAEKRGEKTSAAGFFARGGWTDWMVKYSLFLYSSLFVGKFQRAINQGETQAMSYIFFFWKHMSLCTRVKHVNEEVQVHGKYERGGGAAHERTLGKCAQRKTAGV